MFLLYVHAHMYKSCFITKISYRRHMAIYMLGIYISIRGPICPIYMLDNMPLYILNLKKNQKKFIYIYIFFLVFLLHFYLNFFLFSLEMKVHFGFPIFIY